VVLKSEVGSCHVPQPFTKKKRKLFQLKKNGHFFCFLNFSGLSGPNYREGRNNIDLLNSEGKGWLFQEK
jgi:hypothetical protein